MAFTHYLQNQNKHLCTFSSALGVEAFQQQEPPTPHVLLFQPIQVPFRANVQGSERSRKEDFKHILLQNAVSE